MHAGFRRYYNHARLKLPGEVWMREWGFVHFDRYYPAKVVMRRHKAFNTDVELTNYIRENAPAHVYHSAAIYKYPAAPMGRKEWLGADLIFDLDADHIVSDQEKYSYEALLELVKRETQKLIDFLINDFGFDESDLEVVFSGSRGYHIHITENSVRQLGSTERREILDYITATGLELDAFLKPSGDGNQILISEGWGKRLLNGLIRFLHDIADMPDEEALVSIRKATGMDKRQAKDVIRIARDETVMNRIENGQIPKFSRIPAVWAGIARSVTRTVCVESADRPDEPVTSDIKRLIRLPSSLHGKSSLVVKPLEIDSLADFQPLEDAVVFGDSDTRIRATRNTYIKLKGEHYRLEEGETVTLPEYVAMYFMCRGAAELEG